jgi:hypothetical protein
MQRQKKYIKIKQGNMTIPKLNKTVTNTNNSEMNELLHKEFFKNNCKNEDGISGSTCA